MRPLLFEAASAVGLPALATFLAARTSRVPVLMYHSVADRAASPSPAPCLALVGMQVTLATFRRQMASLARTHRIVSLAEFLAHRATRPDSLAGSAVLTFDDGFADNLACAVPVLEEHRIPATFFVIGDCLAEPPRVPALYRLYALLDALDGTELSVPGTGVDQVSLASNPGKRTALRTLAKALSRATPDAQTELLGHLEERAARHGAPVEPTERFFMTRAQVQELAARGFEIGAHSVTHAALAGLPPDRQRGEIVGSAEAVRALTGADHPPFAYPFGFAGTYSAATGRQIREAGCSCALTTRSGLNGMRADTFELRRLEIGEFEDAEFAATVSGLASFPKSLIRRLREPRTSRNASEAS